MLAIITCLIAHLGVPCLSPPKGGRGGFFTLQRYGGFPALPNFRPPIGAIFSTNSRDLYNLLIVRSVQTYKPYKRKRDMRSLLLFIYNQLHDLIIIYIIQRSNFSQNQLYVLYGCTDFEKHSFCYLRVCKTDTLAKKNAGVRLHVGAPLCTRMILFS